MLEDGQREIGKVVELLMSRWANNLQSSVENMESALKAMQQRMSSLENGFRKLNNDLNPVWNEHFEFIIEDASTQHLVVKIYDDEGFQAAELIGCAQVQLKDLEPGKVKDVWLKLVKDLEIQRENKYRGQVHLELLYCPNGMESGFTNLLKGDFSMTSLERVLKGGVNGLEVTENRNGNMPKKRDVIVRGVLSVTDIR